MIKALVIAMGAVLAAVAGVTYVALELGQVTVVETYGSAEEGPRLTHVWFVRTEASLLLEAGHPDNPWVRDLAHATTLRLIGEDTDGEYTFVRHQQPSDHERIRGMMRTKYGWRDWWIALLFDTSQSFPLELEPVRQIPPSTL